MIKNVGWASVFLPTVTNDGGQRPCPPYEKSEYNTCSPSLSQNVGWASVFLPTVTNDGGQRPCPPYEKSEYNTCSPSLSQNVGWASVFLPTVTNDGGQKKDLAHPTKNRSIIRVRPH